MKEAFGVLSTDWREGINWTEVREWRLKRAREAMDRHGLGAMLLMYDENIRYVTSTMTPGWNQLKPGLRYAVLTKGKEPILYEQGDIGYHIRNTPPGFQRRTSATPMHGSRVLLVPPRRARSTSSPTRCSATSKTLA